MQIKDEVIIVPMKMVRTHNVGYDTVLLRMCTDCGHDVREMGEEYMVWDHIWIKATYESFHGRAGMLCIGCLENRLGRQLTRDDFKGGVPLNWNTQDHNIIQSLRLRHRLQAEPPPAAGSTEGGPPE